VENETALIQRARSGDSEAFAALVDGHQRYVYNLALRVVSDVQEAQDLAQETFVRAWVALPNFRGGSAFRTWLYRIVTNLCYSRLPGLRRSLNDLGDDVLPDLAEPDAGRADPAREAESGELRSNLHRAIDALEDRYRLLVVLRYQQELSYEEIAGLLNLPLGTVKTGIHRAKEKLRSALMTFESEEPWTTP
jgi:RNA polymerase sigma-70 factor (ECF subfamily)